MPNFVETIKNYFTSHFIEKAASTLGENPGSVSKAVTAIIPTSLAGILYKATSSTEGAKEVFETAKNANIIDANADNISSNEYQLRGANMFSRIFENKQTISSAISSYSGIKDTSASSLLDMILPVIMAFLGKHARENNLSASGLAGFLSSQKDQIQQGLPSALTPIGGMFGLNSLGSIPETNSSASSQGINEGQHQPVIEPTKRPNWLIPLIVIVLAVLLLWYFSRSCGETKPNPTAIPDSTVQVPKSDTTHTMSSIPTDSTISH